MSYRHLSSLIAIPVFTVLLVVAVVWAGAGGQGGLIQGSVMSSTSYLPSPFTGVSAPDAPVLEFCFEVKLTFSRIDTLRELPSGIGRGAVYIEGGTVSGPRLNGRVIEYSGGDWAAFRPDEVLETDARYMLEADDGTHILMRNRGFLWGRTPDVLGRIQDWMFRDGPAVDASEFYLRAAPSFEVERGPHDWLTRHIFIGIGTRQRDGNTIRYYALL